MKAPPDRFAVFDIEALDWNRFRVAQFVTTDGDVVRCDTPARLAREVERFPGRVFAHFGGRYDFFFLPRPASLTLSGSGILRAQLGRASLYDSWFLFQMSLAKIGKAVGVHKFEGKSNRIEELSDEETAAHCLQDCRVLMAALASHRRWCLDFPGAHEPSWPATAGGTAVYALAASEPDVAARLRREVVDLETWLAHFGAVSGGRVEVWQLGRVKAPVYAYDINSSYPQSWCDGDLPLGPWRYTDREVLGAVAVYRCRVRQSRAHLPLVAPGHAWRYDGEAWCTSEEVGAVRAAGGAVDVVEGWTSDAVGPFGVNFVGAMYEGKKRGDPWAKVSINSAHGKLSQNALQASYAWRDDRWARDLEVGFPAWHMRPLIGAFILARARLRLWRVLDELRAAGWRVLYCDTDCVHTDCPPAHFPGRQSPDELGAWKLETADAEAVYVAPKVYALRSPDGTVKAASKGLPKAAVGWKEMMEAAKGERQVFSDTSGLVSFRSQGGEWGPFRARRVRALVRQTGGKKHVIGTRGETGRLVYPDAEP